VSLGSTESVSVGGQPARFLLSSPAADQLSTDSSSTDMQADSDARAVASSFGVPFSQIQLLQVWTPALAAVAPLTAYKMLSLTLLPSSLSSSSSPNASVLLVRAASPSPVLQQLNYSELILYVESNCTAVGTFGSDSQGGCLPCPPGAYCPGGGRAWPLPGWWSLNQFQAPQ